MRNQPGLRPHLVKSLVIHAVVFGLISAAILWEGSSVARQESLRIAEVQSAEAEQAQREREAQDVTVLAISRSGQFSLGQDYVPDDRLWDRLSAANSERPIRTLIIKGDRQSPYEKVIMATDMARALNVTEITWAVERK